MVRRKWCTLSAELKPGGASGGHDVGRSRDVVAHDLGGELAQKQATGVSDLSGPGPGIGDHETQVLRRDAIGYLDGFIEIVHQNNAALTLQRMPDRVCAGVGLDLDIQL